LPQKIAPTQAVLIPITKEESDSNLKEKAEEIVTALNSAGIRTVLDKSTGRPGAKYFAWERQGVPVRLEFGPRDLESNQVILVRRDNGEKSEIKIENIESELKKVLDDIQKTLYEKALKFRDDKTFETTSYEELKTIFAKENAFVYADWCGEKDCEAKIQEETGATTRCIPFDEKPKTNECIGCDREAKVRVIFDKAY
jgi:prolyl-tRNA synthetase